MNARENWCRRGLLLAIRVAPEASASSPGYLTIARCRVRSFTKPRIALANVSFFKNKREKSGYEENMNEKSAHELERRFVTTRQVEVAQHGARVYKRAKETSAIVHRMECERYFETCERS